MIYLFYFTMAVVLFLLTGKIGRMLRPFGYISVFSFSEKSDEPAFNFVYRVFIPLVFIFLLTYLLHMVGLSDATKNIWLVVLFYFSIRLLFIVFMGRFKLSNFSYFMATSIFSISIALILYNNFLSKGDLLFPEKGNVTTELWFILIIFIYDIVNKIGAKTDWAGQRKREENYVILKHKEFFEKYDKIVSLLAQEAVVKNIVFSIMIIENFNRPRLARRVEAFLKGKRTYGIMQVQAVTPISDEESVRIGTSKIVSDYKKLHDKSEPDSESAVISSTIRAYNSCDDYVAMVWSVYQVVSNIGNNEKGKLLVL